MRLRCTVHQVAEEWATAQPSAYLVQQGQLGFVDQNFYGDVACGGHVFSLVVIQAFNYGDAGNAW